MIIEITYFALIVWDICYTSISCLLLPMPVVDKLGMWLIIAQLVLVAWAVDVYTLICRGFSMALPPIVKADSHVCENE